MSISSLLCFALVILRQLRNRTVFIPQLVKDQPYIPGLRSSWLTLLLDSICLYLMRLLHLCSK